MKIFCFRLHLGCCVSFYQPSSHLLVPLSRQPVHSCTYNFSMQNTSQRIYNPNLGPFAKWRWSSYSFPFHFWVQHLCVPCTTVSTGAFLASLCCMLCCSSCSQARCISVQTGIPFVSISITRCFFMQSQEMHSYG